MESLEWGQAVEGVQLSASIDRTTFKPDEPIRVSLVFRNSGARPHSYQAQGTDFDYDIDCRTESGEQVAATGYGVRMRDNRGHGREVVGELGPDQQLVSELLLSRHVDLSLAAKYNITFTRAIVLQNGTSGKVLSNSLKFEVRE